MILAVLQQWCGINVIFNYAQEVFAAAGYQVSDILFNIVVTGAVNVIFTFVAFFTIDRFGRRFLLLTGLCGLVLIYTVLGLLYRVHLQGKPMLVLVLAAIACYAMSLGAGHMGGHRRDLSQSHPQHRHRDQRHGAVDGVLPAHLHVPAAQCGIGRGGDILDLCGCVFGRRGVSVDAAARNQGQDSRRT